MKPFGIGACIRLSQFLVFLTAISAGSARADDLIRVPLTADHWHVVAPPNTQPEPDVQFVRHEGFPQGILVLKAGAADLNDLTFGNGTIEFDMKPLGEDIPGIQFRKRSTSGAENAEEFYVRTFPDCRASNDCIQYAPVINGFMLWNFYPEYQSQAFILDGWNHIKLVVSGHRMNVFVNRMPNPALIIGSLEGSSTEGSIELRGPAMFGNLTVAPNVVEGLSPDRTPDPTKGDRRITRKWELGPLTQIRPDIPPTYADMPNQKAKWTSVTAGRFGMVNLNRNFAFEEQPPKLSWARSNIISDRSQMKHVSLAWLGRVWVFVNGKLITQATNLYNVDSERRDPDGRLSFHNDGFDIPLQRGQNEVVIALLPTINENKNTPNRYGWGFGMRVEEYH
jgi:hypothetical protein